MITQQELESRLWAAANSLRGPVDPSDFKAYIFPLLFYKRISDAWDEEHARALADFGGDETLAVAAGEPPLPDPRGLPLARPAPRARERRRRAADGCSTGSSRRTRRRWPASSATSPGATRRSCPSTRC